MILQAAAFWLLAATTILSAFFVVAARNPVRAVLWLILAFFSAAGLFVLLGAEFLAMLLVIVYVGAVAVLFLFVVMMLDVDFAELKQGFLSYLPLGGLIAAILAAEMVMIGAVWQTSPGAEAARRAMPAEGVDNVRALGLLLYDHYVFFFQTAGLVLLVAMIGAIVLTLRHRPNVKRQNPGDQVARRAEDAMDLRDVKSGEGIGE